MMESDKNQQNLEYEKKLEFWRKVQTILVNSMDTLLFLVYVLFAIYVVMKNAMTMMGFILLVVITLFNVWMIPILLNRLKQQLKKMKKNRCISTILIFFDISIIDILLKKTKPNRCIYNAFIFFDISIVIVTIITFFMGKESLKDKGWGLVILTAILTAIAIIFRILLYIVLNRKELIKGVVLFTIIFVLVLIVGMLDDLPIAGGVFLIGLFFVLMSEDMLKMIQFNSIDNSCITKKYEEQIKTYLFQQKIYVNIVFAILYVVLLITSKFITSKSDLKCIYKCVYKGLGVDVEGTDLELWLFRGQVYTLLFISVVLLVNAVFVLIKKVYNKNKENLEYGNMAPLNSIFNPPEVKIHDPKIIHEINIGKKSIDKINPEILITNREEIPKDIQVFLEGGPINPYRRLLIIYPNRSIYECKYKVEKNKIILKEEIKLINKQDFKNRG